MKSEQEISFLKALSLLPRKLLLEFITFAIILEYIFEVQTKEYIKNFKRWVLE